MKVDITTAGRTIIIETDAGSLDEVCAKALELWHATCDSQIARGYSATGFTVERADQTYVSGHDAE